MRYSDQIAADQCGRYKELILYCHQYRSDVMMTAKPSGYPFCCRPLTPYSLCLEDPVICNISNSLILSMLQNHSIFQVRNHVQYGPTAACCNRAAAMQHLCACTLLAQQNLLPTEEAGLFCHVLGDACLKLIAPIGHA